VANVGQLDRLPRATHRVQQGKPWREVMHQQGIGRGIGDDNSAKLDGHCDACVRVMTLGAQHGALRLLV
jgi:hypothetical protein